MTTDSPSKSKTASPLRWCSYLELDQLVFPLVCRARTSWPKSSPPRIAGVGRHGELGSVPRSARDGWGLFCPGGDCRLGIVRGRRGPGGHTAFTAGRDTTTPGRSRAGAVPEPLWCPRSPASRVRPGRRLCSGPAATGHHWPVPDVPPDSVRALCVSLGSGDFGSVFLFFFFCFFFFFSFFCFFFLLGFFFFFSFFF